MCVEHPTRDAFWDERNQNMRLSRVNIPVYLGCDWDNVPMHLPSTFSAWRGLVHNPNVRVAMLPPASLSWPWEGLHYEVLAWYDHWLKSRDTGIMEGPPIRYVLPEADGWRTASTWPPPESKLTAFALRADGALSEEEGHHGSRLTSISLRTQAVQQMRILLSWPSPSRGKLHPCPRISILRGILNSARCNHHRFRYLVDSCSLRCST